MEQANFPNDYFVYDTQHLLDQYGRIGSDIQTAYDLVSQSSVVFPEAKHSFDAIYLLGMGGSAISGDFTALYLRKLGVSVPIFVVRDYDLPQGVTDRSLVIAISYSGNTEETISTYRQALKKTSCCIALASGGKLEEISKVNRNAFIKVPKGYQPRTAALTFLWMPVLSILEHYSIIPSQKSEIVQLVKGIMKPDFKTLCISISQKLHDKIPIIYASDSYYSVAYRFKTQINENAKTHAFSHAVSELNHNELVGYTHQLYPYHIISFQFDDDHRRIVKRMGLMKDLLAEYGVETTDIKLRGDHFLTKLFSAILIGDLSSYYLALRMKVDPSPVQLIENFKVQMGPFI